MSAGEGWTARIYKDSAGRWRVAVRYLDRPVSDIPHASHRAALTAALCSVGLGPS